MTLISKLAFIKAIFHKWYWLNRLDYHHSIWIMNIHLQAASQVRTKKIIAHVPSTQLCINFVRLTSSNQFFNKCWFTDRITANIKCLRNKWTKLIIISMWHPYNSINGICSNGKIIFLKFESLLFCDAAVNGEIITELKLKCSIFNAYFQSLTLLLWFWFKANSVFNQIDWGPETVSSLVVEI